jgi:hypothetical protein
MKKIQFVLILLALLAMLTSVAAAPMAGSAISLIDVRNDAGGGVIFIFNVNGQFSKSELKGSVEVQGVDSNYGLYCTQKDDTTVHCTTSRKTGGENVKVTFGGAIFWTYVPEPVSPNCYNVYDLTYPPNGFDLVAFTTFCQYVPANYGDIINVYNPAWNSFYNFEFLPQSPYCYMTIIENAYYWNVCVL